jgi:hypothetical protein
MQYLANDAQSDQPWFIGRNRPSHQGRMPLEKGDGFEIDTMLGEVAGALGRVPIVWQG